MNSRDTSTYEAINPWVGLSVELSINEIINKDKTATSALRSPLAGGCGGVAGDGCEPAPAPTTVAVASGAACSTAARGCATAAGSAIAAGSATAAGCATAAGSTIAAGSATAAGCAT